MLTARKMNVKLGFAPVRRNMYGDKAFHPSYAAKAKQEIEQWLTGKNIDFVNLDFLNDEGLMYHARDVDAIYKHFIAEDVDAIFCPHCNFGAEDVVTKLSAKLGKPLLLWGPREEEPDDEGYRYRDSQCGLFATTKVLQRAGVPFSYITNCSVNDRLFEELFDNFLSAAAVVKYFKNMRVGQISLRPDAFWSVKCNEGELLERFGIDVVPLTLADLKKRFEHTLETKADDVRSYASEMEGRMVKTHFPIDKLTNVAALVETIKDWADEENLTTAATVCWGPMFETVGIVPCYALSELSSLRFPVICEGDIHGAITSVMAQSAVMGKTPTFLADVTARHPGNDNAELFWHCGVFPGELAHDERDLSLSLHYNRKAPAVGTWELKEGDISIVRFDGVGGNYSILMGHGKRVEGPYTHGTYAWIEFKDWPKWEHRFIYGPYIHHCVGIYGKIAPALYEACRYIPGLSPDPVEPTREEIETILRNGF